MFRALSSCAKTAIRCLTALLTTPDGKPGLKAEYFKWQGNGLGGQRACRSRSPAALKPNINLTDSNLPIGNCRTRSHIGVQWTGFLTPHGIRRLPHRREGRWLCPCRGRWQDGGAGVQYPWRTRRSSAACTSRRARKIALSVTYGVNGDGHPTRNSSGPRSTMLLHLRPSPRQRMPMSSSRLWVSPASLKAKKCR